VEKLCVLSFDEMYVSNRIDIDKKEEQKLGPHKSCQCVMARGLLGKWKQPVYYDQPMKKDILLQIISKLYRAGFTVTAIVSDMGSCNMSLWNELDFGYNKNCSFQHPDNSTYNIFVFADALHLLKLLRNRFLEQRFHFEGHILEKFCFEKLLTISNSDVTLAHKITGYHFKTHSTPEGSASSSIIFKNRIKSNAALC
jgi:hypothetical protein